MLTDFITLRNTEQWKGFDSSQIIPKIYGNNEVTPIPYSADNKIFVLADHPCQAVTQVIDSNNFLLHDWGLVNGVDNTGNQVAFLKFAQPVTGTLRATVVGKSLFNAADIIIDFANITNPAQLKALQGLEFATKRYELAGVLQEKITARAAIDIIAQNIGFSWNAASQYFGYLFPTTPSIVSTLIPEQAQGSASIVDWYNVLTVQYDYSYAQSKYKRAITLINKNSVKKNGRYPKIHDAQWVKNLGDAYDICLRLLTYYSQPVWQGTAVFDTIVDIREGQWITLNHARIPINSVFITSANDTGLQIDIAWEGVEKSTQNIEVESTAILFEDEIKERVISEGIEHTTPSNTQNTSASNVKREPTINVAIEDISGHLLDFFVFDKDTREYLSGATVSVDGGAPTVSDAAGKVVLEKGTPGTPYVLTIEHPRYKAGEFNGVW